MEYIEILYNEYLCTSSSVPKKHKEKIDENFLYWLEEKRKILNLYEQFLQTMDMTPARGIVEVDKSERDSVLPFTPYHTQGMLISKYVSTKQTDKKGIVNVNGKIVIKNKQVFLEYKGMLFDISKIRNFITQLPIDDDTLSTMVDLMDCDKNVFIGIYGKMKDENRMSKLRDLYELRKEIIKYVNKNIDGEVVYTKDYYLAAITPKLKYKQK